MPEATSCVGTVGGTVSVGIGSDMPELGGDHCDWLPAASNAETAKTHPPGQRSVNVAVFVVE